MSAPFVEFTVNGEPMSLPAGTTIAAIVAGLVPSVEGCAVARNGEVLPRSSWRDAQVQAADRLEVLSAVAGG